MTTLPFSAVIGQDNAKLALLLATMQPRLGGVLLRGQKGSAKTTLARGLARLLPEEGPFVELPLGATEDRLLGSIDLAELLTAGTSRYRPGLLAAAHGGVLYVDEINLLADHLVDALLDVAVSGINRVEREGISHVHPARFVLVASMNPEEGELRPQLLDRFGLAVDVVAPTDAPSRAMAVTRQLEAEAEPQPGGPREQPDDGDADLRERLAAARPAAVSAELIAAASRIALAVGAEGLRADLMLCRAAAAHAGWNGRDVATDDDLRRVAVLVLAHRRRRDPFDDPGLSPDELEDALSHLDDPSTDDSGNDNDGDDTDDGGDAPKDQVEAPEARTAPQALPHGNRTSTRPGRDDRSPGPRGRYIRDRPAGPSAATVAAVPTAIASASRRAGETGPSASMIVPEDLREAVREERVGRIIVLVVDTSGSMGAQRRIAAAKGVAIDLLSDVYQLRNRVALVVFRGERAEVVMRPTGSVEIARARLADLPTGGTTPLAAALDTALEVAQAARRDDCEPLLVLLTDGRATVGGSDPVAAAHAAAARIATARVPAIVVDAEDERTRLGIAGEIARAMKAECFPLADVDDGRLEREIRRLGGTEGGA